MADELDDLITRDLSILDDLAVPDLWERIVTLSDTERVEPSRRRRWWPVLVAAAVVLVAAVGVLAWNRDTHDARRRHRTVHAIVDIDTTVGSDNTVRIAIDDSELDVSPTATAGWVSFAVDNTTDRIRTFEVFELLGDTTYEAIEAAAPTVDLQPTIRSQGASPRSLASAASSRRTPKRLSGSRSRTLTTSW